MTTLTPGGALGGALVAKDQESSAVNPLPLDVVPPLTLMPSPPPPPILPAPRVLLLVDIPKEFPVSKMGLEEGHCFHAKLESSDAWLHPQGRCTLG